MWEIFRTAGRAADDKTIGRMRFACWIKWTQVHTHSEYVTFIAFP